MAEYKTLEFAPATRGPIAHLWNNKDWIAERKEDGWRLQLHLGGPCSRLYAITRGDEELGNSVKHLSPQYGHGGLGYTVLDGEILPHNGQEFHSLASLRAGLNGEHKYNAFDILYINGTDVRGLPLLKRIELLNAIVTQVFPQHPFLSQTSRAMNNTRQFLNEMLAAGGEGVVLKNLNSTYGHGWLKAKRVSTFDAFITKLEPGYHMPYGKMHIAVLDGESIRAVGKCGISNENVRIAVNKDPNSFIGKVVEVQALKIDPSNSILREPRFIRLRPDLTAFDCTWQKLNSDAMVIELE